MKASNDDVGGAHYLAILRRYSPRTKEMVITWRRSPVVVQCSDGE